MLNFIKRKKKTADVKSTSDETALKKPTPEKDPPKKTGLWKRLKGGLRKTRQGFSSGMATALLGKKNIDDELLEELEEQLLIADVGVEATQAFMKDLTARLSRKELKDVESLLIALKDDMTALLKNVEKPLIIEEKKPYVILMVGINGAGKTTTIGKLAKHLQNDGKKVMLAAGDTFRAAAIEQLQTWGERNNVPVIAQQTGADSASVIFDAMDAAKARGIDVLLADTAGRLHTKDNLMEELKKIVRVIKKYDEHAPHEIMLVLDAGNGQNALIQALEFHKAINLTGVSITKLDGTAKGGIIFAVAKQLNVPVRFIGVGEKIDDLQGFEAEEFVEALFDDD